MDAAALLLSVLALAPTAPSWLGRVQAIAVILALAAVALLAAGYIHRRWRGRVPRRRAARRRDSVGDLKDRLRQRLAQPAALADPVAPGPTVGAGEAFEADLAAAAREVLPEAGWRRAAAKHLLHKRLLNGHALNGSEAIHWRQLGALALLDDTQDALAAYTRAAELAPGDPDLQMLLGVLYLRTGRLQAAEAAFRRQMDLANGEDGNAAVRHRAGLMLGDALMAKGAREEALAAYEAARSEILALAEREPASPRWRRDASVTHDRIGELLVAEGQVELALESFRRSLELADALAQSGPGNAALQHDLSVAHDRIGEALELRGDLDGALESYRRGLAVAEALTRSEPGRLDWAWDVTVSLDRVGDVLAAKGKADEALAAYRRGLRIAEALAADDPMRMDWQRDLAASCHKIGALEARCGHEAEAREALEQGRAIIARLAEIARHQAQWRADLSKFDAALRNLGP